MKTLGGAVAALALLSMAPAARAQEPMFEALGQAPIVAGDRVRARDRALDEALRQAVEQATATLLMPAELVARASDLQLRIYPKAKAYVTTYRILDEGEQPPGTFQVHLSAKVATARLARDLGPSRGGTPARRARAVVCAAATGATDPAAQQAAEGALRELVTARNVDPLPGPPSCDPAAAAAVLRSGTAQAALTAELELADGGAIRGTKLVGVEAKATVRLVDPDGRTAASAKGEEGGYAPMAKDAAAQASRAAVSAAARILDPALAQRWPLAAGPTGGVQVRVTGLSSWAEYRALQRALATLPGVAAVEPRRFVKGEVDLLVHTATAAAQLAAHLNRLPPAGMRVGVRTAGDALEIAVVGDVAERG